MPDIQDLGPKALAVFAFAAYHQLESGQPVTKVVRDDGKGHQASEEGVRELEERDLASVEGNDIKFSDGGQAILSRLIESIRGAAAG